MIKLFNLAVVSRTSSKVLAKLLRRGKWTKPGLSAEPIEHCGGPHQVLCIMGLFRGKQRTFEPEASKFTAMENGRSLPVAFPDSEV